MKRIGFIPLVVEEGTIYTLLCKEKDRLGNLGGRGKRFESEIDCLIREVFEETCSLIDLTLLKSRIINESCIIVSGLCKNFVMILDGSLNDLNEVIRKFPEKRSETKDRDFMEVDELVVMKLPDLINIIKNSPETLDSYFAGSILTHLPYVLQELVGKKANYKIVPLINYRSRESSEILKIPVGEKYLYISKEQANSTLFETYEENDEKYYVFSVPETLVYELFE